MITLWSDPKVVAALQPWAEVSEHLRCYCLSLRSNPGLKLANTFGVILVAEKLAEEFDLSEVTCAPGTNEQMQSKLQPLVTAKRPFH